MLWFTCTKSNPLSNIVGSDLLPRVKAAARRSSASSKHRSDERKDKLDISSQFALREYKMGSKVLYINLLTLRNTAVAVRGKGTCPWDHSTLVCTLLPKTLLAGPLQLYDTWFNDIKERPHPNTGWKFDSKHPCRHKSPPDKLKWKKASQRFFSTV